MLYKEGTFGYWWTIIKGKRDIKGKVYNRDIDCSGNNLTSLEGAPKEAKNNFRCDNNNLVTLKGAPRIVDGCFWCDNNNLVILKGAPEKVSGDFLCSINNLKTLKGAPKEVGDNFWCTNNNLTTLEGAPEKVGKNFDCSNNKLLKDASDIFVSDIQGKFICDIMTDKEYRQGRELYLKLKDLDKVRKILKLKDKMR